MYVVSDRTMTGCICTCFTRRLFDGSTWTTYAATHAFYGKSCSIAGYTAPHAEAAG
jgi:hypothetical protein